jgi:hypothetical protein
MRVETLVRALERGAEAEAFDAELRGQLRVLLRRLIGSLRPEVSDAEIALVHAIERVFANLAPAPAVRARTLARILLIGA